MHAVSGPGAVSRWPGPPPQRARLPLLPQEVPLPVRDVGRTQDGPVHHDGPGTDGGRGEDTPGDGSWLFLWIKSNSGKRWPFLTFLFFGIIILGLFFFTWQPCPTPYFPYLNRDILHCPQVTKLSVSEEDMEREHRRQLKKRRRSKTK